MATTASSPNVLVAIRSSLAGGDAGAVLIWCIVTSAKSRKTQPPSQKTWCRWVVFALFAQNEVIFRFFGHFIPRLA